MTISSKNHISQSSIASISNKVIPALNIHWIKASCITCIKNSQLHSTCTQNNIVIKFYWQFEVISHHELRIGDQSQLMKLTFKSHCLQHPYCRLTYRHPGTTAEDFSFPFHYDHHRAHHTHNRHQNQKPDLETWHHMTIPIVYTIYILQEWHDHFGHTWYQEKVQCHLSAANTQFELNHDWNETLTYFFHREHYNPPRHKSLRSSTNHFSCRKHCFSQISIKLIYWSEWYFDTVYRTPSAIFW